MEKKHYILSPVWSLRGWELLPYAVQHSSEPRTIFFRKDEWELLKACDGHTAIDPDRLSEKERDTLAQWEKQHIIIECGVNKSLLPAQQYRFFGTRFKESVQWSITGKCNSLCRHCFMSAPRSAQGEPSWDQLMDMLGAFERCGIKYIGLTGGEPTVRGDLLPLIGEIIGRGMVLTSIYTNGYLITDSFLDELEKTGAHPSFQFSFDGVGHHDWLRGIEGAEKAVTAAMRRCGERGYRYGASMVLFKENKDSIRETVDLMAELGCSYIKICNASPQGEWLNEKEHYLPQREVYEAFLEYIPHFFEDGKPLDIGLEGFFSRSGKNDAIGAFNEKGIREDRFDKTLLCGHVRRDMYVSPKGNVLPCMSAAGTPFEEKFPNMLKTPLEKILDKGSVYSELTDLRVSDLMKHDPECSSCEYRTDCCGGCRASALRDHPTDYLARDELICEYFRGGWKKKKDDLLRELLQKGKL